jgi:flagellar hook-associated protein 1 FlgK
VNLSNVLSIGANGLAAASQGTQVASQNISNASTTGYTRRIANMSPIPLSEGGGVRANGSSRETDSYLERRGLGARAQTGEANARVQTLAIMDTVFGDGQGSVGDAIDAFDASVTDMASTPNSTSVRQVVLSRADDLTQAFHHTSEALTGARVDANARITDSVDKVNQKLTQIGALGAQIVAAKNVGQEAGDLEDKRDQLIRDIADTLPVSTLTDATGGVTVLLGGSRSLVSADNQVHPLIATADPTNGDVRIYRQTAGATEDITGLFTTGSIGGTISARDGALADARNALDQLAFDYSTAYNTQHMAGVGLDGNTGRNLDRKSVV